MPPLVHVKAAFPATSVGVLTVVKTAPAVSVAPVSMFITPFVTEFTAVILSETTRVGIPLVPESHPKNVPVSALHMAIVALTEAISIAEPAALVRET